MGSALLLTVTATALGACGDDSSGMHGQSDSGSQHGDAGSLGSLDAGIGRGLDASQDAGPSTDAAAASDAAGPSDADTPLGPDAAAVAAALTATGLDPTRARAMLVFEAYCQRSAVCNNTGAVDSQCIDDGLTGYDSLVSAPSSDACLDAALDLYGCDVIMASCGDFMSGDFTDACSDLGATYGSTCNPP